MQSYWTQRSFDSYGRRDNPSEKALSSHNVAGLKKKWEFASGGAIVSGTAITRENVFLGNFLSKVFAVHRSTGTLAWDFTTGAFIDSSPACPEGVLFIGSNERKLVPLAGGEPMWNRGSGEGPNYSARGHSVKWRRDPFNQVKPLLWLEKRTAALSLARDAAGDR